MNIKLEKAEDTDAEKIVSIRNECFYDDYIKYGECPGYNIPKEKMIKRIKEGHLYKILIDNEIAGDISVQVLNSGIHWIGCVTIAAKYQNRGAGSFALKHIQNIYNEARIWQLETPRSNTRNCHFYEKLGFKIINTKIMTDKLTLCVFEKQNIHSRKSS